MSIWNKVLIGLILVASPAFFYMALRTLKTHQYWRELAQRHEEKIRVGKEQNRDLVEGKGEGEGYQPGIKQLRLELQKMLINRGRAWNHCDPQPAAQTDQTGQAAVTTDPHGIGEGTPLYVFEETDAQQGGRYLGEFKVTTFKALDKNDNGSLEQGELPASFQPQLATADTDGNGALNLAEFNAAKPEYREPEILEPSMKMTKGELQRLAASAASEGTWALYEIMPADSHDIFADLGEDELKNLFTAENAEEYLKDGRLLTTEEVEKMGLRGKVLAVENEEVVENEKIAIVYVDENDRVVKPKVDEDGKVVYVDENGKEVSEAKVSEKEVKDGKGKYVRRLRDYAILFKDCRLKRSMLIDRIEAATRDRDYVLAALNDAEMNQLPFRQKEKKQLAADLIRYTRERDAVDGLRQKLEDVVKAYRDLADRLIEENKATAGQIAQRQMEAVRRIDQRTRRMARSGAGGD